jgi:hypothetical protein
MYVCVYVHEAIISLMPSEDAPYPLNLLTPTCHVTHKQFNVQQLYSLPTLYLSENKQRLVSLTDKLIGFYNRDEKCLLRGTDWLFK